MSAGRRSRRGVALLTVLWLVAALGAVGGAAMMAARLGSATSRNRIVLTRAAWAREACLEVLRARFARDSAAADLDSIDFGRTTWCRARVEDPNSRLHLNLASEEVLAAAIGVDSLVDALLDWRDADAVPRKRGAEHGWYASAMRRIPRNGPFADVAELRLVRGFESVDSVMLAALFTVSGDGRLNPNMVSEAVLRTLPGMGPEAVDEVRRWREARRPLASIEQLADQLPDGPRQQLLLAFGEHLGSVAYAPTLLIARIEGHVGAEPAIARATVRLVPTGRRLAIVGRETE
jgi:type II secretory pathway component PulK